MIELRYLRKRVPGITVGIATAQLVTKSTLQYRNRLDSKPPYPEHPWSEWQDVPVIPDD